MLVLPVMQVEACAFAGIGRQTIILGQGTTSRAHKAPVFLGPFTPLDAPGLPGQAEAGSQPQVVVAFGF